jgi:hypothetical protein
LNVGRASHTSASDNLKKAAPASDELAVSAARTAPTIADSDFFALFIERAVVKFVKLIQAISNKNGDNTKRAHIVDASPPTVHF